jgi:hypothetical protein
MPFALLVVHLETNDGNKWQFPVNCGIWQSKNQKDKPELNSSYRKYAIGLFWGLK